MEEIILDIPIIIIYLDNEFRCHVNGEEGFIPFETSFFNGREELIPFYRLIPEGNIWIREDGKIFYGEMIAPIGS